ncbi:MAG TPA: hypothetical protein VLH83_08495 [Chthoniobacterales bacterium]|nr:hypothetical protein [Chthoniobacterales bacterium]
MLVLETAESSTSTSGNESNAAVTFSRLTLPEVVVRFVMKKLIVSAVIGTLAFGSALADRPRVEEKTQSDNADYEYVTITGSHLKQKVRKRHIITDTRTGNVLTIDQREMERNGNAPLAEQLSRYPGISISHH